MAESKTKTTTSTTTTTTRRSLWPGLLLLVVAPVALAAIFYQLEEFDPAPLPNQGSSNAPMIVPKRNSRVLEVSERIGDGLLPGPEDIAYDAELRVIYTGCSDGWIKRVRVTESAQQATVENWAYVGGRPLGLALGLDKQLVVAEPFKGLLKVTREGVVELLTDEAEGLKFRLTDGVDVADDGLIYFTDASYKYYLEGHKLDLLEGRPNGRILSFDPSINRTQVLARNLYFPNGLTLSPGQDFVVFCETGLRRCRKCHIKGEKKGLIDNFIDNLPGFPDNIHYDGNGHYWIAFPTVNTLLWDKVIQYPFLRKVAAIFDKYVGLPDMQRDGGILAVDLDGKPVAVYSDPSLSTVTSGVHIETHLYYGFFGRDYIIRLNLAQHAAVAV